MSTRYSDEFKSSIIARLLPPHNASVHELAEETGVPKDTLYAWRIQYRRALGGAEVTRNHQSDSLSNKEKLAVVIETASLSEVELGEYCRRKGEWDRVLIY